MEKINLVNVVTDSLKLKLNFSCNRYKDIDGINRDIPTLIIGYEKAKMYVKNFNILQKVYPEQNLWWTFTKRERGIDFQKDTEKFYEDAIKHYTKDIQYKNINVYTLKRGDILRFARWINNGLLKYTYITRKDFMFIYCPQQKMIYGISLRNCAYCYGVNVDRLCKHISENKTIISIKDFKNIPYSVKRITGDDICSYLPLYPYF